MRFLRICLIIAIVTFASGCGLFKKKCDCPSFGIKETAGPTVVQADVKKIGR